MNQSWVASEGLLRLAAVVPVATPTPVAPLPAESLESETAAGWPPSAATTMNRFIGTSLGPADNRAILATAKERVNHAQCVVAHRRAGWRPASHPRTVLAEATPP